MWMLAVMITVGAVALPGNRTEAAAVNRIFGQPEDLGSPINSVAIYDGAYGKEDGRDVLYTTSSGSPARFQVVDLVSRQVLRAFTLPGTDSSWTHLTAPDGTVYIGGNGKLYRYLPATKQVEELGGVPGETVLYSLSIDEQGRIYAGTYPNGKVVSFNPATRQFTDYGVMAEGQKYVRSTAYHNGYLYAGIGATGSIVRLNVATGEKQPVPLPNIPVVTDSTGFVFQMEVAGHYLVAGLYNASSVLLFYDLDTNQWSSSYHLNNKGIHLAYGQPGSNKVYFVQNSHLMEVDLTSLAATDTGVTIGTVLRGTAWVSIPGDPELPGLSLATVTFGGGVTYMNLETKITKSIEYPVQGNPIPIQALEKGPDGKLYMSGYPGGKGARFNPSTGSTESFALGQAEGMGSFGNKLYFGIYPGAHIQELDPAQPFAANTNPKEIFSIPEQDRPFVITSAENKLWIGTIPEYGHLGGSLTMYDPVNGGAPTVYPNVVNNQSIVGIAVRNGKLYGSTSIHGGLGIDPVETEAKIFTWDIATGTKVKEVTPVIPGAAKPTMISGLTFGPDGLLWGAADGTIFAMNPDTLEVVKSKTVYAGVSNYGRWRPVYIRLGQDGLLYTTLYSKLTVIDPDTLTSFELADTTLMTLGDDGNIYYSYGTSLMKIAVKDGITPIPIEKNLPLANPGFEETGSSGSIPGWPSLFAVTPNVSFERSAEQRLSGAYSLKLTDRSTTETVAVGSNPLAVTPGVEYKARVNVFLKEGRTLAVLNFYNSQGKEVGNKSVQITSGAGKWQSFELKMAAPAGASTARVVLFCSQLWMTTAYYDDVSLTALVQDTAPPVTKAVLDGPQQNGWYTGDVRVALEANDDASGVKETVYSTDGGTTWNVYDQPLLWSKEGKTAIKFRSTDTVGHVEAVQEISVPLDKTAPSIRIEANGAALENEMRLNAYPGTLMIAASAQDTVSGVVYQQLLVDGRETASGTTVDWSAEPGAHLIHVQATDAAGHTASQTVTVLVDVSPDSILAWISQLEDKGELSHPLRMQVENAVQQAVHQWQGHDSNQAVKHLEDALKHLSGIEKASEQAVRLLKSQIGELIRQWS